jgi:hypothetical protein
MIEIKRKHKKASGYAGSFFYVYSAGAGAVGVVNVISKVPDLQISVMY